jgi:hypothetical protein
VLGVRGALSLLRTIE